MKGMQRIRRGASFAGVCAYALEDGRGQIIGGNMSAVDMPDLVREFRQICALRHDIGKPVWHNSLRLPRGERISEQKWVEIADAYMQRMGFSEVHQRVYVLHDDPDGQHIHIIANRITSDGSVYLGRNENLISTKCIGELEKFFGLQITKGPQYENGKVVMPEMRKPKKNEIEKSLRTGEQPVRMQLQDIVRNAMDGRPTLAQFIERLEAQGVTVRANVASTGRMNGFSFEYQGVAFKGSDLGKSYTWMRLKGVLDYEQDRDYQILADRRPGTAGGGLDGAERRASGAGHHADGRGYGESERRGPPDAVGDAAAGTAAERGAGEGCPALAADLAAGGRSADASEQSARASAPGHRGAPDKDLAACATDRGAVRVVGSAERTLYELSAPAAAGSVGPGSRGRAPEAVSRHVKAKIAAWRQQAAALDAEAYRITLVGRRPGMPAGWVIGKGKGPGGAERLWTPVEVEAQIPFLSRQNARGFDVYITPFSRGWHYILVDDMRPDALEALRADGYRPVLVQQSSANNFQVVLAARRLGLPDEHERKLANSVMLAINQRYGDPRISGVIHPFRMAGFANKKPGKGDQFTRILETGGGPCRKTQEALEAARAARDAQVASVTRTRLQIASETLEAVKTESESEYDQVYLKTARQLKNLFAGRTNWSVIDFRSGLAVMKAGGSEADVRGAIARCSPDLAARHGAHVAQYLARTVQAVVNEYNRQQARRDQGGSKKVCI